MDLITPAVGLVFWSTLVFSVLFFLLAKFAWRPILQGLNSREESIKTALESAETARKQMVELSANNEKLLLEAKSERDLILREAKANADKFLAEAKDVASKEAQVMISKAQAAIEAEKKAALDQMKAHSVLLSLQIAEKVIRKELSDKSSQEKYAADLVNSELVSF